MNDFVPLLLRGLKSVEQGGLCTICTGVVVDLCGSVGASIQHYADDIMEAMFLIIREASAKDRYVRAAVISCFGDMGMSIGASFEPYMAPTMMVLTQASQQQANLGNEDMIALTNELWSSVFTFSNKLRCSVLEAYSGILVGLAESQATEVFAPHVPRVLMFLSLLASDNTKDDAVLEKAVVLLGHIAHEIGGQPEVRQQLSLDFANNLIQEAAKSQADAVRETAQWAKDAMEETSQAENMVLVQEEEEEEVNDN